jgi:hypothetical protein
VRGLLLALAVRAWHAGEVAIPLALVLMGVSVAWPDKAG